MSFVARLFVILLLLQVSTACPATNKLGDLKSEELQAQQQNDIKALKIYHQGLAHVLKFIAERSDIFSPQKNQKNAFLGQEQREEVRALWARILDYYLAIDSIGKFHASYESIANNADRDTSFAISYGAYVLGYSVGLQIIDAVQNNPELDILLNEKINEQGLPENTYRAFKFRFLNVIRAFEFVSKETHYWTVRNGFLDTDFKEIIDLHRGVIWKFGKSKGGWLTLLNGVDIIKYAGFSGWFPVQAGVSEWMGDTKVHRAKDSLISSEQIAELKPKLKPGDVLLIRREWYLSNIGLPGFWPHAALYIGTPEERREFRDNKEVASWVISQGEPSGDFEKLLENKFATNYGIGLQKDENGHVPRVIEAQSEGVSFNSIEHSADADTLSVLRPRLSLVEKAVAIMRAFNYGLRPYDFNFDFVTDSEIVCTELVYKAYEPTTGNKGIHFPLVKVLGRLTLPANEMVKQFNSDYGTERQQFDLISFLDGNEGLKKAIPSNLAGFRESWKRSKWFIFSQFEGSSQRP
jgi:hypothetical protein